MNQFIVADPNRCIGCRTCEIACALAHGPGDALAKGTVDQGFNPRLKVVKTAKITAPVQCRHCEDAPCANACPNKAIVNTKQTIQVDETVCIGCKNCILACPFGVMDIVPQVVEGETCVQNGLKLVSEEGIHDKANMVALKCDLCIQRPQGPACVEVCPMNAFIPVKGTVITNNLKKKRAACAAEMSRISG